MVQLYEVEKTGGVWLLLTRQEFEIIYSHFQKGLAQEELDEETERVAKGLGWVNEVVHQEADATPIGEFFDRLREEKAKRDALSISNAPGSTEED